VVYSLDLVTPSNSTPYIKQNKNMEHSFKINHLVF
jgi:hypothetical protein